MDMHTSKPRPTHISEAKHSCARDIKYIANRFKEFRKLQLGAQLEVLGASRVKRLVSWEHLETVGVYEAHA